MFRHTIHSNCRKPFLAAILGTVAFTGGCARWSLEDFSLNKLRDDRAVDIDNRLEGTKPIVVNPF